MKQSKATVKEMRYKLYLAQLFESGQTKCFARHDLQHHTLAHRQEGISVSTIYGTSKVDFIMSNHRDI